MRKIYKAELNIIWLSCAAAILILSIGVVLSHNRKPQTDNIGEFRNSRAGSMAAQKKITLTTASSLLSGFLVLDGQLSIHPGKWWRRNWIMIGRRKHSPDMFEATAITGKEPVRFGLRPQRFLREEFCPAPSLAPSSKWTDRIPIAVLGARLYQSVLTHWQLSTVRQS